MVIAYLILRSLRLGRPDIRPALVLISVGVLTIIITILRTVSVIARWDLPSRVFVVVESYVAIYGACLPALRVMTRRWKHDGYNYAAASKFNKLDFDGGSPKEGIGRKVGSDEDILHRGLV